MATQTDVLSLCDINDKFCNIDGFFIDAAMTRKAILTCKHISN